MITPRFTFIGLIIILLLIPVVPHASHGQSTAILPSSLAINGSVTDNYVNMSYTFGFSGLGSDSIFETNFNLPQDLFLSNISMITDHEVFWGRVKKLSDAQQDYQDAVDSNKSAVLVSAIGSSKYNLEANIKSSTDLSLVLFVEGFLLRHRATYTLNFVTFDSVFGIDLSVNTNLISSRGGFRSFVMHGLSPVIFSDIANGKHMTFSSSGTVLDSTVFMTYELEVDQQSNLIGYNNGQDQFFIYQLAPEIYTYEAQAPKDYMFIIDKSGSMDGNRIDSAKSAFVEILSNLNAQDYFNVIWFDSTIGALANHSLEATSENIQTAVDEVNGLQAGGGTNFYDALTTGLSLLDNNIHAAKAVTILSDGDPTSGITNRTEIKSMAKTNNTIDAPIFTISLGNDIDTSLMSEIAFNSHASHIQISDNSDITSTLLGFYDDFSAPITTGMSINISQSSSVYPMLNTVTIPIYNGSEVIIVGKFDGSMIATTTLNFLAKNDTYTNALTSANTSLENSFVEKIWAIYAVRNLLEQAVFDNSQTLKDEIVDFAINYGLLVEGYTGMIVVVTSSDKTQLDSTTQEQTTPGSDSSAPNATPAQPPVQDVNTTLVGSMPVVFLPVIFSFLVSVALVFFKRKNSAV